MRTFETFPSGRRAPTWRLGIAFALSFGGGWILGAVTLGQVNEEGWAWIALEVLLGALVSFLLTAYLRAWARRPNPD